MEQEEARATSVRALAEFQSHRGQELSNALARISQLESSEARMGGTVPSLPPSLAYPIDGVSSRPANQLRAFQDQSLRAPAPI